MNDVVHLSNPAGRLYEFARAVTATAPRVSDQHQLRAFFAEYVGFDGGDNALYFAAVAEIMALPVQARRMIDAIERPVPRAEILLRPIESMEHVLPDLGVNGAGIRGFGSRIAPQTVEGLEVTSEVLAHAVKAVAPTYESLTEIRNLANDVIDALAKDAGLSPELREAIGLHARSIVELVNRYKVTGAQSLLDEADALIGVYVRHQDEASQKEQHPAIVALRKLVSCIAIATSVVGAPGSIAATVDLFSALPATPTVIEAPVDTPVEGHADDDLG